MRRFSLLLALSSVPLLVAGAEEAAPLTPRSSPTVEPTAADPLFEVPLSPVLPSARGLALELPDPLRDAIEAGRWSLAADRALELEPSGEQAFLASWCLVKARRAAEAEPFLDLMEGPPNWVLLTQGKVLMALHRPEEAIDALALVDLELPIAGEAQGLRARLLEEAGRLDQAQAAWLSLAAREGPRSGTPEALIWLAKHHGEKTPEAYPFLRRLWYEYPKGGGEVWASAILRRHHRTGPTDWERARRAERLMWRGYTSDALTEAKALIARTEPGSEPWCRAHYVRGRSYAMRGNNGAASLAFADAGAQCVEAEGDFGERILWWKARSEGRMRHHAHARDSYSELGALYPGSNLADDAWLKAGEHAVDLGDWEEAQAHWEQALVELPPGDRTAEAGFRLAWRHYVQGDTAEARRVADQVAAMPIASGRFDVPAARYWSARWALYPDVEDPWTADPSGRDEAVARWVALCQEAPWSIYAVMAWMRLSEEAPERARALAARPATLAAFEPSWLVRREFRERSADAIGLARVGLMQEAHGAWDAVIDEDTLHGDEYAWWLELRRANGEELEAHADARIWLRTHPWDPHRANAEHLARLVHPRAFGEEVDSASEPYRFAPLTLQALIRTESNFDHEVRSHAGARGLSQLMPYTARRVAKWDKQTLSLKDLYDPEVNLGLGARYLDYLYGQFQGNPMLAAAGYNAGEHRVEYWLKSWGNLPTDEFVERIPYPETRGYVKRVVGSWQAYELLYGEGARFPDLGAFVDHAQPDGVRDLEPDPE